VAAASLGKVMFIALSLGLDVFAVSVGVGMRGASRAVKFRIGLAFTAAEISMTLIGVMIGGVAGRLIGDAAGYFGFAALCGVGGYMIVQARRGGEGQAIDFSRGWGLFLGALSISLDSLGIGFSILYIGVPLAVSLICIGCVAALSTTLGLSLGQVVGTRAEEAAELAAGVILFVTGLCFAALKYFGV
jgi:putative Mn2+ efflux pump MntP